MRNFFFILLFLCFACNTGNLEVIIDLPMSLNEVSGIETSPKNNLIWMINDSGNSPILYGLDINGETKKAININAKNRDWEDLTTDSIGNIYIGNFGNNNNASKDLSVLKISADSIAANKTAITPEFIYFNYPDQKHFPPKRKQRYFDCEALVYFNSSLYLFTKSRNPKHRGKTNLYQLPTKAGNYNAKFLNTFTTCNEKQCWVTSADINTKGNKLALLTENAVFVFSKLNKHSFFNSEYKRYDFTYSSQKESVAFKNDSTLYIADEYLGVDGGNLYEFKID